jgi:hypothetical protein
MHMIVHGYSGHFKGIFAIIEDLHEHLEEI